MANGLADPAAAVAAVAEDNVDEHAAALLNGLEKPEKEPKAAAGAFPSPAPDEDPAFAKGDAAEETAAKGLGLVEEVLVLVTVASSPAGLVSSDALLTVLDTLLRRVRGAEGS